MAFLVVWFLIQISFTSITSNLYSCSSNLTCGCSLKPAFLTKIIGGEGAGRDTWGWAVSIRSRNSHTCGGSLISPEFVITAAHCLNSVADLSKLRVTAGSTYLSTIKQQRSISKIFIHRNYDSETYVNDIAFIRLSSPFNMNDRSLALICLPTKTIEDELNNTDVVVIGWGVLSTGDKLTSNTLQQVTLKTIANNAITCRRTIRNVTVQMCAGVSSGGKDTCQGDSGGPLMIFFNQRWYLIGITSYGKDCALATHAGVYTRVSVYEESIGCLLKNNTLCIPKIFIIRNSVPSISAPFYINSFFIFVLFFDNSLFLK